MICERLFKVSRLVVRKVFVFLILRVFVINLCRVGGVVF